MSSDYSSSNGGNLFLQALHISPNESTTFGTLPSASSSLNAKYWKKIFTDRDVAGTLVSSDMKNDGSFFIAGTFNGAKSSPESANTANVPSGDDIFKAINNNKLAFDQYGNIRTFQPQKNWKNPVTATAMSSNEEQLALDKNNPYNKTFVVSKGGRWTLIQDTELAKKGTNTYYVIFNPIHSGEYSDKQVGTSTFKKWYQGINGNDSKDKQTKRLREPLIQKYCEMTTAKPRGAYQTSNIPYMTSFDEIPTLQDGDGTRYHGDISCTLANYKEGVYDLFKGPLDIAQIDQANPHQNFYGSAKEESICSSSAHDWGNWVSDKGSSFIADYLNDRVNVLNNKTDVPNAQCPAGTKVFCTSLINAGGDVNIKNTSISQSCGIQPPTPPPTTKAPTTTPPPTTQPPTTPPPTTQPPTTPPPTTQPPTTQPPTTRPPTAAPTIGATMGPTAGPPTAVPTIGATAGPTMGAATMGPTKGPSSSSDLSISDKKSTGATMAPTSTAAPSEAPAAATSMMNPTTIAIAVCAVAVIVYFATKK
jgi:hypothetical protein